MPWEKMPFFRFVGDEIESTVERVVGAMTILKMMDWIDVPVELPKINNNNMRLLWHPIQTREKRNSVCLRKYCSEWLIERYYCVEMIQNELVQYVVVVEYRASASKRHVSGMNSGGWDVH